MKLLPGRPVQGLAALCSLVLGTVVVWAAPMVVGQGRASLLGIPTVTTTTTCTNAYHIDADCDGYGVGGNGLIGPDADDNDPRVNTTASVTLDKVEGGFAITTVHLEVKARIPGADEAAFMTAANNAKAGCPISKVMST